MKLTQATVDRLAAGGEERLVFDDDMPGFGLRLFATGRKSWLVQYRHGRRQRRVSLGDAAVVPAAKARAEARRLLSEVGVGRDPQGERQRERKAPLVREVVDLYLARHATKSLRPRSLAEVRRHLERHAAPLHRLTLAELDRRRVAELLHRLAESSGTVASNRVRASLSACFAWAMRAGLAEANPVAGTPRQAGERPRERVLSLAELALVWRHAGDGAYGALVRLLILTGLRREEMAGLRPCEVALGRAELVIGAARMKAGREHRVLLPAPALDICARRGWRGLRAGTTCSARPTRRSRRGRAARSGWTAGCAGRARAAGLDPARPAPFGGDRLGGAGGAAPCRRGAAGAPRRAQGGRGGGLQPGRLRAREARRAGDVGRDGDRGRGGRRPRSCRCGGRRGHERRQGRRRALPAQARRQIRYAEELWRRDTATRRRRRRLIRRASGIRWSSHPSRRPSRAGGAGRRAIRARRLRARPRGLGRVGCSSSAIAPLSR